MPLPMLPKSRAGHNNHAFFQQLLRRIFIRNLGECVKRPLRLDACDAYVPSPNACLGALTTESPESRNGSSA